MQKERTWENQIKHRREFLFSRGDDNLHRHGEMTIYTDTERRQSTQTRRDDNLDRHGEMTIYTDTERRQSIQTRSSSNDENENTGMETDDIYIRFYSKYMNLSIMQTQTPKN